MNANAAAGESSYPPPKQALHWPKALLWHGVGFLTLVVLTWCDALFDLINYILGQPSQTPNVEIKTVVVVLLWIGSAHKLYRIVSRLSYLERFLNVCSWCHRIQHQDVWLSLEEHFQRDTGGAVSHGICPECANKIRRDALGRIEHF